MKNFIPFKKGSQSQGQPLDSSRAYRKKAKLNLACLLISASFLLSPGKAFSQPATIAFGNPINLTGWTIGGSASVVGDTVQLTPSAEGQAGYIYYNSPQTFTSCGGYFSVDFDFKISNPYNAFGDGIAFFFLEPPLSGFSGGGSLGLPNPLTGTVLTMDTYDNDGDGLNPEDELLGYATSGTYSEGLLDPNPAHHLAPILGHQDYMTDGAWHHVTLTYAAGAINVYMNGSHTPSMSGTFSMAPGGYFGFSAGTGYAGSTQMITNVSITTSQAAPIGGTPAVCGGAGVTTTINDAITGGTWSIDNTGIATVDPSSGVVTGVSLGTATVSYYVTNGCGSATVTQVVTVNPTIAGITGAATVCGGSSVTLIDATPAGLWASSNVAIATVDTLSGKVTGIAGGTANITYTSDYCYATQLITVAPPVAITGDSVLYITHNTTLSDASGGAWSSSNTSVASVDPVSGFVTSGALGTATITYTIGSCYVTLPITVEEIPYCLPVYSDEANACSFSTEFITNFWIAGAGSSSLGDYGMTCNGTGYGDRRTMVPPVVVNHGGTYTVNIAVDAFEDVMAAVWVDFNNDGIFETSEFVGGSSDLALPTYSTYSGYYYDTDLISISMPYTATPGLYNMRIRIVDLYSDANYLGYYTDTSLDPCVDLEDGEALDYNFIIQNNPPAFTNGGTQALTVCENSGATDITPLLEIADSDYGQTETWTVASAPSNGIVTTGGTQTSGGGDVTPTGFSYTPASGYSGTDAFTIQVSDGAGGTTTTTINVTVNPLPTVSATSNITQGTNPGLCSAVISYTPAIANATSVSYALTGATTGAGSGTGSGSIFNTGVTTVTISASNGCGTVSNNFNVTVNDNQPPVITAPPTVTINGWCAPVSLATAGTTLGTPVTSDNCGVLSVVNNAPALFPVGTTTVTWTVTDLHANTATATQHVVVNPETITFSATETSVSCNVADGGNHTNGAISTTVGGGTTPYSYAWTGGATGADPSGLAAGTYSVTVTDAHGCSKTIATNVGQPPAIVNTPTIVNVSCHGGNGSISAVASGGTAGYTYAWRTGGAGSAHADDLSSAPAGTYTVTVTDAKGCTLSNSFTITQPTALTLSATCDNVSCHGGDNGSISTTVGGGITPYSYSWSGAAHGSNPTGLSAGTYDVTVTDAHGCSISGSSTISQPATAVNVTGTTVNLSCYGADNGSITTSVSGGTPGYTYTWSNGAHIANLTGLTAGSYTVTVSDSKGCTCAHTFTITQPAAISITALVTNVSCYGGSDGGINISVSGGSPPYTYVWSNGSYLADPTGLAAGCYSVTVTDAHRCTATGSYTITQPAKGKSGGRLSGGTGGNAENAPNEILIYPNPTTSDFSVAVPIALKEATILITDIAGKQITSQSIKDNDGTPYTFSLGNIASGVYLVKVMSGETSYVVKLIKR